MAERFAYVDSRRIRPLDGLRGLAVLVVIGFHYGFSATQPHPGSLLYALRAPLKLTWSGVDLFFVLSGFLITTILIRTRDTANYFSLFYLRRACRILPLYFLLLGTFPLAHALLPADNGLVNGTVPWWMYLLFVQNIVMSIQTMLGAAWLAATWSLCVEEQFYLFVPILVLWLRSKVAIPVLLALLATAPVLRYLYPSPYVVMMNTPFRADPLLVGAILAYLIQIQRFMDFCRGRNWLIKSLLGILLAGMPVMALHREWFGPFDFTWLAALYGTTILIVLTEPGGLMARLFSNRLLVWFGAISYAMYMLHEPVLGVLHYAISGRAMPKVATTADVLVTLLSFVVTCALGAISTRYVEAPFTRFGHRRPYRKRSGRMVEPTMPEASLRSHA